IFSSPCYSSLCTQSVRDRNSHTRTKFVRASQTSIIFVGEKRDIRSSRESCTYRMRGGDRIVVEALVRGASIFGFFDRIMVSRYLTRLPIDVAFPLLLRI